MMMMTTILFALLGLAWLGAGVAMVGLPEAWLAWTGDTLRNPLRRYLLGQGMLLAGVLLILGRHILGSEWLWLGLGIVGLAKGGLLLASSQPFLDRLMAWWQRQPVWFYRAVGAIMIGLATLLAVGVVRSAAEW